MELMSCPNLAVPNDVMQHVVHVESSYNPYAIGVVGGRLARQPRNLAEALATVRMLESRGFNFSVGVAQVNRHNLARYGLQSYERAFEACPNLQAGSRILAECYGRSGGNWGKSFSCYYSGDFVTGYRHGYVQKIYASMRNEGKAGDGVTPIEVIGKPSERAVASPRRRLVEQRAASVAPVVGSASPGEPTSLTAAAPTAPLQSLPASTTPAAVTTLSPAASIASGDQAFVF